ncbi:MAG: Rne/Rng family ribonuclease [Deltaproteobacteria bacterium]|nr:Rne/Rng family ribonuclease [Deltaproteobacteria bacterium]
MGRKMIINAIDPEEVRIAILGDRGVLENLDIETRGVEKNKGNIYKAIVRAVEPALNAAFVDYGAEKEGFLTAGEVDPKIAGLPRDKYHRVNELLKPKQEILVQVVKEEVGSKGAVLTTYLSIAGRYLVIMPGEDRQGVSRRIEDDETRRRMRESATRLDVPDGMGLIIRTAGRDRPKPDLMRDLQVLTRLWENIRKEAEVAKAPALILKEQDVVIRALRDYFTEDIDEIVVDSDDAYDRSAEYMHLVMPKQRSVLSRYVERRPIFHHYRIEEQLEVLYANKVPLKSGGSLVIEQTEALVAIDVNSGKQKESHHEETALRTNLEAAFEAARQLRLRDLGGIIVIDFIDMMSRRNERKVERAAREAFKADKARVKIGRISPNGTLELTRQRLRSALEASVFRTCPVCKGTGHILNPASHAVAVLRRLRDRAARGDLLSASVKVESEAANHLRTTKWNDVQELVRIFNVRVDILPEPRFVAGQDDFTFEANAHAVVQPLPEPNFGPPELPADFDPDALDDEDEDTEEREAEGADDEEAGDEAHLDQEEAGDGDGATSEREDLGERGGRGDRGDRGERGSRRGRRRGRHGGRDEADDKRGAPQHGKSDDPTTHLGLPSFELLDLEAYLVKHGVEPKRGPSERPGGETDEEGGSSRRRRRRRGRGRGREQLGTQGQLPGLTGSGQRPPSHGAAPAMAVPAASLPPAKTGGFLGFVKKLFGG